MIVAKKNREVGVREHIEEVFVPARTAMMLSLFVPRDGLKRGDCVLIVDDVIDSGETQRALMKIAQKAKAEVTGIYALVSVGNEWKSRIESAGTVPVEVVTQVLKKEVKEVTA